MSPEPRQNLTAALIFETMNAYQRTGVLIAGVRLGVFTAIAEGASTAPQIAAKCGTAERGARILCDTLVIDGLLTKDGLEYRNTPETALFLDRRSPAYLGGASDFLNHPPMMSGFLDGITDAVRKGGTMMPGQGTVEPENPVWVTFARAMAPMMMMAAQAIAAQLPASGPLRVLDIAAGHGMFGVLAAKRNPEARITAVDWASVLEVVKENAARFGVADRVETRPGSAFEVDLGAGYDVVLITNFLHHFNAETNTAFLRRVHAALKPGGRAITLEFVPEDDRVSPPVGARFAIVMLAGTAEGDAYTFSELAAMARAAEFASSEHIRLETGQSVIISTK